MAIVEITQVTEETTKQPAITGLHAEDFAMSMTGDMLTKVNVTKEML